MGVDRIGIERSRINTKTGDWAGYGEELNSLRTILDQLAEIAGE